jgi:hypothetical protein
MTLAIPRTCWVELFLALRLQKTLHTLAKRDAPQAE